MKISFRNCDKLLFKQFRDYEITYDQLLARVEEKRFGTKYVVLDDMKPTLNEKYLVAPEDERMHVKYMEVL